METRTDVCRDILYAFLDKWTLDNVRIMTLEQYVSVGDRDTFCQWLETKTRELGSIKGLNSSKFGIYKRKSKSQKPKRLISDEVYSWQKFYSFNNNLEAFENIREEILQIIHFAKLGEFEKIDQLHLTVFVKWKIAYLYSNERLIPIFRKDVLFKIATHYGLNVDRKTKISEIQKIMISKKPSHLSIYEYSEALYERFGRDKEKVKGRRVYRKATFNKGVGSQTRKGAAAYAVEQKHNELQLALYEKLINEYGEEKVFLEKDYVDVKLLLEDEVILYEVKSDAYASDCVKRALGQILSYSQKNTDKLTKKLVVVGQYAPNEDDNHYINYVKRKLKISFEYENIEL